MIVLAFRFGYASKTLLSMCTLLSGEQSSTKMNSMFYYVLEFGNKKCRKHITKSESPVEVCCNLLRGRIHNGLCNKLIRREIYDKVTPWFIPNMNLFDVYAIIWGAVVNKNEFYVFSHRLFKQRARAALNVLFCSIYRYYDRNFNIVE